jgi:hypothetical protein
MCEQEERNGPVSHFTKGIFEYICLTVLVVYANVIIYAVQRLTFHITKIRCPTQLTFAQIEVICGAAMKG